MADALLRYLRESLPAEIAALAEPYIAKLENGDYEEVLKGPDARLLFGLDEDAETANVRLADFPIWSDYIFHRLGILLADRSRPEKQSIFFCVGYAALLAFVQSNITGPPLPFDSAELLSHTGVKKERLATRTVRTQLLDSLGIDGIAAYRLTPNVELLCLADAIFTTPPILKYIKTARWAKLRVAFLQQRLLSEVSSSLQGVIYDDLDLLQGELLTSESRTDMRVEFALERATVHSHHGFDALAREDLEAAKRLSGFEFALTGLLGKRTKFQHNDISQLVVLAKSNTGDVNGHPNGTNGDTNQDEMNHANPENINLNDDTLLDAISFTDKPLNLATFVDESALPPSLATLDPSAQPQLNPLDSTMLLTLASCIKNTSPQDGLTREQTMPYATRVLEGGSSNWQVYTQALLLRSRIEGYNARTVERGLLQLQALVDQVIAETGSKSSGAPEANAEGTSSTFLPRGKESDSAPVTDRIRYVFQLASPTRWDLEAELAARWVSLGGLRSALDIYERLEMWAEAALCWAATEREDQAKKIVRRQLFHATGRVPGQPDGEVDDEERWSGPARDPAPADAPRLYCILGDIDSSPEMYETAWKVSNHRYARAQRSLGRYYFAARDYMKAAEAYEKSLKANQLNQTSWFALGCALLELGTFDKAAEAFSRCVQLDEQDAEGWSNLAAALLRKEPPTEHNGIEQPSRDAEDLAEDEIMDRRSAILRNRRDALNALKRAASIKHDSSRIWENVLIVSASLAPPDFTSMLSSQRRLIELRGPTDGEQCIDVEILAALVQHIISLSDSFDTAKPGLQRMTVKLIDENVVPLITGSAELWRLVSKLALWRKKPSSALDAEEKAWRAVTSQPGWETENEARWNEVVEATVRLCDSYESLGPRERTQGMGAGEPVAKDWKFKARSAVRGILGRGKASWDGTEGWETLTEAMAGLKSR